MHDPHSQPIQTSQGPMYVRECGCGGVHLCLGGLSLNLARETATFLFEQLGNVLGPAPASKAPVASHSEVELPPMPGSPSGGWVRHLFAEREG